MDKYCTVLYKIASNNLLKINFIFIIMYILLVTIIIMTLIWFFILKEILCAGMVRLLNNFLRELFLILFFNMIQYFLLFEYFLQNIWSLLLSKPKGRLNFGWSFRLCGDKLVIKRNTFVTTFRHKLFTNIGYDCHIDMTVMPTTFVSIIVTLTISFWHICSNFPIFFIFCQFLLDT